MTVEELIERLREFHGHESVVVHVDIADVTDMVRAEGPTELDLGVWLVEPGSSAGTGTVAMLFLE